MIQNLAVALGTGLLIGAERERRKGEGPSRSPAGIGTFTVASLAGAISFIVGGEAAALAGFVDTHSATISVASLVASEKMSAADAVVPILVGLSTNTVSKMFLAGISGGRSFALRVTPGLIIIMLAAWASALNIPIFG